MGDKVMPQARIRSEYQPARKPPFVAKWEKWANEAPSDIAALVQLTYFQALQIRAIKLILVWTLIIVPILFALAVVVLSSVPSAQPSRF